MWRFNLSFVQDQAVLTQSNLITTPFLPGMCMINQILKDIFVRLNRYINRIHIRRIFVQEIL